MGCECCEETVLRKPKDVLGENCLCLSSLAGFPVCFPPRMVFAHANHSAAKGRQVRWVVSSCPHPQRRPPSRSSPNQTPIFNRHLESPCASASPHFRSHVCAAEVAQHCNDEKDCVIATAALADLLQDIVCNAG